MNHIDLSKLKNNEIKSRKSVAGLKNNKSIDNIGDKDLKQYN